MFKWPMRGHFLYLRFKAFSMRPRTPQCEVFWGLLLSSEHSGVSKDSESSLFPSVGLHPQLGQSRVATSLHMSINFSYVSPTKNVMCYYPITSKSGMVSKKGATTNLATQSPYAFYTKKVLVAKPHKKQHLRHVGCLLCHGDNIWGNQLSWYSIHDERCSESVNHHLLHE
jgi:hypothetical protein